MDYHQLYRFQVGVDKWFTEAMDPQVALRVRLRIKPVAGGPDELVTLRGDEMVFPDRWTHVAATFDGTELRLYQDGQQVASGTFAPSTIVIDPDFGFGLGCSQQAEHADDDRGITGFLDDVQVFADALTAEEAENALRGVRADQPSTLTLPPRPLFEPPTWLQEGAPVSAAGANVWKIVQSDGKTTRRLLLFLFLNC